ncbi:STAS/SEC14 domain-containing protein [Arthrobacter antioxidans]|uniref:DUF7793 family protein n=1 Tax=Arthrobacter antioxidans TaxID=2895818 RepID=UPI001FFF42F4|nr:STAS/SEC14 domain-containing protein [Arthrobacter antioxidans]
MRPSADPAPASGYGRTVKVSAAEGRATLSLLRPALLRLTWAPETEVQEADARDVLKQSLELVGHVPYAILVDMRHITIINAGARAAYGSERMVLAAAMLGVTPVDRVIAASVQQSVHDVRFFTDEQAALDWLTGHLPDPSSSFG